MRRDDYAGRGYSRERGGGYRRDRYAGGGYGRDKYADRVHSRRYDYYEDYDDYYGEYGSPSLGERIYKHFSDKKAAKIEQEKPSVKCVNYTFDNALAEGDYVELEKTEKQAGETKSWFSGLLARKGLAIALVLNFAVACPLSAGAKEVSIEQSAAETPAEVTVTDEQKKEGIPVMPLHNLNVYSEASTSSDILHVLPAHQLVRVTKQKGRFYRMEYKGKAAYIVALEVLIGEELEAFIRNHVFLFPEQATTKEDDTPVLSFLGKECIGTVPKGEKFAVYGEYGGFYLVRHEDNMCFLALDDVFCEVNVKVHEFPGYDSSAGVREQVVEYASCFIGNPYVWGGTDPSTGADCSGYVQYVMKEFGISLPRVSAEQSIVGKEVSLGELRKGDLVFFKRGSCIGHVAIYSGDGKILEAKGVNYGIVESDLDYSAVAVARSVLD